MSNTQNLPALTVGMTAIHEHDGLYSLNDLHRAAGSYAKDKPALFLRNEQTQALLAEISKGTNLYLSTTKGSNGGTYACRELAVAYAAWVSPAFHLRVIRAFLDSVEAPSTEPATVPATDLMAAQTRELELSRKLIEVQEKLLAATGKKPRRKAVRPITSDEIAEMKRLRALGLPVAEIARRTGRNSGSISQLTRDVADTADLFAGTP